MSATIHLHPRAHPGATASDSDDMSAKWLTERLSAVRLHCEAASNWLDRPDPDILEARLSIEALRADLAELTACLRP